MSGARILNASVVVAVVEQLARPGSEQTKPALISAIQEHDAALRDMIAGLVGNVRVTPHTYELLARARPVIEVGNG
jgi:hypothetical protein